jgi:putative oxidoreductase
LSSGAQYLFENEYQVPLIPWELAAYLGTAAELILPIFLVVGLATRLMAFSKTGVAVSSISIMFCVFILKGF